MRILSLFFSVVVAVSLAGVAFIYLERRIGQQRIYVQDEWLSSGEVKAYRVYGEPVGGSGGRAVRECHPERSEGAEASTSGPWLNPRCGGH
jgi:hypothetical protein